MWNDLSFHITSAQSLAVFRQRLKTFLFSRSYPDILADMTYSSLLIIIIVFLFFWDFPWTLNSWHYLGHVKHIDDDDDDDDESAQWREDWCRLLWSTATLLYQNLPSEPTCRIRPTTWFRFRSSWVLRLVTSNRRGFTISAGSEYGQQQTLNHTIDKYSLTKFEGGLPSPHKPEYSACNWLQTTATTNSGSEQEMQLSPTKRAEARAFEGTSARIMHVRKNMLN